MEILVFITSILIGFYSSILAFDGRLPEFGIIVEVAFIGAVLLKAIRYFNKDK